MEKKSYLKVLGCSGEGKVSDISSELLHSMISQCENDVQTMRNAQEKIRAYLNIADLCHESGHQYYALIYYRKALESAIHDDYENMRMRNRHYAFYAAKHMKMLIEDFTEGRESLDSVKETASYYEDLYYLTHYLD